MDWVNVTAQFENAVDSAESHDYLMREGYAFVHVSAQSAGICCLPNFTPQTWDPVRYGLPARPTSSTTPGDAYALDMFAQIAQALKSPTGVDRWAASTCSASSRPASRSRRASSTTTSMQWQGGSGEHVIDAFLIHGRVANRAARDLDGRGREERRTSSS